jgi:hypothetical protein
MRMLMHVGFPAEPFTDPADVPRRAGLEELGKKWG